MLVFIISGFIYSTQQLLVTIVIEIIETFYTAITHV